MYSSNLALIMDFGLLILQHFVEAWFTAKYIHTKKVGLFCLLYVLLYTGGYAVFEYFLIPYKSFKIVVLPLVAIGLVMIFRERSLFKSILFVIILHVILAGSDYLLLLFFTAVLPEYVEQMLTVSIQSTASLGSLDFALVLLLRFAGLVGVFFCVALTYYILRGGDLDSDDRRLNRFLPVFAVEMIFTAFLMYFSARTVIKESLSIWLMLSFMVFFLVLDILIWHILRSVESAERLKHEKAETALCAEANAAAYKQLLEGNTRFRMLRHDMLNQLQTASLLYEQGETASAVDQLRGYAADIRSSGKTVTGNGIVDAVLSIKESTCKDAGIGLEVDGKLPDDLPLDNNELCSVVGNMLDNAIHGVTDLPGEADKTVRFAVTIRDDKLVLSCKNPVRGTIADAPALPGPESEHGWGRFILKRVAEAHGGAFTLSTADATATALFWIPLHQAEAIHGNL